MDTVLCQHFKELFPFIAHTAGLAPGCRSLAVSVGNINTKTKKSYNSAALDKAVYVVLAVEAGSANLVERNPRVLPKALDEVHAYAKVAHEVAGREPYPFNILYICPCHD